MLRADRLAVDVNFSAGGISQSGFAGNLSPNPVPPDLGRKCESPNPIEIEAGAVERRKKRLLPWVVFVFVDKTG